MIYLYVFKITVFLTASFFFFFSRNSILTVRIVKIDEKSIKINKKNRFDPIVAINRLSAMKAIRIIFKNV